MKITWIANEKQFNLVLPLASKAIRRGIDFEILAVDRIANGFGDDVSAFEIHDYLAKHGLKSTAFARGSEALEHISIRRPDFVFTSTPYDLYLSPELSSVELNKYSTVCNVAYGASMTTSADLWDAKNPFLSSNQGMQFVTHQSPSSTDWSVFVGNVKLESLLFSTSSNHQKSNLDLNLKRVIGWRPRWTLNDEASFEETLKALSSFSQEHNCELRLFVHPLMATELPKLDKQRFVTLRSLLLGEENETTELDVKLVAVDDYLWDLKECSVLVSDASTLMNEAFSLGIPVIYSGHIEDLNSRGLQIVGSGGLAKTPEELQSALKNLLAGLSSPRHRAAFMRGFAPTDKIFLLLRLHKWLTRFGVSKPRSIIKRCFRI